METLFSINSSAGVGELGEEVMEIVRSRRNAGPPGIGMRGLVEVRIGAVGMKE